MSLLSCSRKGCKNILCDRLSSTYGYICDECFDELVYQWRNRGSIKEFLETPKRDEEKTKINFYDLYNNEFKYPDFKEPPVV